MHGFQLIDSMKGDGGFSGGTVSCGPNGSMFDVGAALTAGDGIIYTDDDIFAQVLRSYPALEQIPDDQVPGDVTPVELPYSHSDTPSVNAGWTPQVPDNPVAHGTVAVDQDPATAAEEESVPSVEFASQPGEGEVAAEHADEPATVDEAVSAGEAVSGPSRWGN